MTETAPPTVHPSPAPTSVAPPVGGPPRRLLRRRPRWLGGVSAGIAEYTGLPTALVRLLFVVAGLMGWGLLLYPALWIVIPEQ